MPHRSVSGTFEWHRGKRPIALLAGISSSFNYRQHIVSSNAA